MRSIAVIIVGAAFGAIVGVVLGIGAAALFGWISTVLHPDDPSAGGTAIIGVLTIPGGALVGLIVSPMVLLRYTSVKFDE